MSTIDCIRCKGKFYNKPLTCGHQYCPIYSKIQQFKTNILQKDHFVGTAPSVFVGRYDYPNLNVGIMAPPDKVEKEAEIYDAPKEWNVRNFQVEDVLNCRGALINSRFKSHIKAKPRFLEMTQEVALSSKPVDIEFKLEKKPTYSFKTSDVETVLGARAKLKKASFNSTPKIDHKVDYIVSDDLKSVEQLNTLYKKGYDETFLTRVLSTGNLGLKKNRKLVPTRFSITAVDSTLGNKLVKDIKNYKEIDYNFFFGGYLGNYYLILVFPRLWSYELFEMYMPFSLLNPNSEMKYTTDFEPYQGRKKYAEETAGGFYSVRLGILEKLKALKRQGAVLALRFITPEYTTPLGVWITREATRNAMQTARTFSSEKELLDYSKNYLLTKFNFNIDTILKESKLFNMIKTQRTIKDYF
jgi:DNA repair protein NreA